MEQKTKQQYSWMHNRAALREKSLKPSDVVNYGNSSSLAKLLVDDPVERAFDGSGFKVLDAYPPESLKEVVTNTNPWLLMEKLFSENHRAPEVGYLLAQMLLGPSQGTKPVVPLRVTQPQLR